MKIERVHIQNYGSLYGQHVFQIANRGLTLVVGDNQDEPRMNSNGAGKSTVFDALDWCLFGTVPKGDHVDSVINEDAGRDLEVTVELEDEAGCAVMVRRYRKIGGTENGVMLVVDRQELTALDPKETQKLIELQLGLDREIFHASVLYGQEDQWHFAEATDAQRMAILTKILQLDEIDGWLERAKAKAQGQQETVQRIQADLARLEGQLQALEGQDFTAQIQSWENDRAERMRAGIQQLNEFQTNVQKAQAVVAYEQQVRESYAKYEAHRQLGMQYDWSEFDKQIAEARTAERQAQTQLTETTTRGKLLRQRYEQICAKPEGECSECGQPVTREHLDQEAGKLMTEIHALRNQYESQEQGVRAATEKVRQAERAKEEQVRLHREGDRINEQNYHEAAKQLREIEEAKAYIAQATQHMQTLQQAMEQARVAPNPFVQKQQELEGQKVQLRHQCADAEQAIHHAQEELRYYEFWVKAFGPKGLKSYILDSRLQEMTDAANEWVRLLTGGTVWVRFETQAMGRSTKRLSNKINIRVFRYNPNGSITERNYKSWSGGEKKRVSWAIDFGLSRLVAARATKRYDVLVLDEVFKHVDRAGGEAVIEMLRALCREKSSIFVVEHDGEFQAQFENTVLVRKQNGRSQILEESDGQAEVSSDRQAAPPKRSQPKKKQKGKVRRRGVSRRKTGTARSRATDGGGGR